MKNIKSFLKGHKIKLQDLAEMTGYSQCYISMIANGKRIVSKHCYKIILNEIVKALPDVDIEDIKKAME